MPKRLIIKTIKLYQSLFSFNFGRNCRFYPSCSEYTALAVGKYGVVPGLWMGFKRILKCSPIFKGGLDLP